MNGVARLLGLERSTATKRTRGPPPPDRFRSPELRSFLKGRRQAGRTHSAAVQAISAKSRQAWRSVVATGWKRTEKALPARQGIVRMRARGEDTGSSDWIAGAMENGHTTLLVFDPRDIHPWPAHSAKQTFLAVANVQSVGAALQAMPLAGGSRERPIRRRSVA